MVFTIRGAAQYCCAILCSAASGLAIVGVIVYFTLNPVHRVSDEQLRKIRTGMTTTEVIAILGPPSGKDGAEKEWYYWASHGGGDPYWFCFDDDGRLKSFH
jgi:outer membrane protein assembly factor BamE (lipoprotein component of BamABCDE complex)